MKKSLLFQTLTVILLVYCSGCSNNSENKNLFFEEPTSDWPAASDDSVSNKVERTFSYLEATLPKVYIDSQLFYVAEGDLLMDADELYYYCDSRVKFFNQEKDWHKEKLKEKAFTVATRNGQPAIWSANYVIRYAVQRNSFDNPALYDSAVTYMKNATADWMGVCNVKFEYQPAYDNLVAGVPLPDSLTFMVRQFESNGSFLAMAFFPVDPPRKRRLLLDRSFFNPSLSFSKQGILRHELGHILGARHEHIWSKEYACSGEQVFAEGLGAKPLTKYDPYSVMHYLCGSAGTRHLMISRFDSVGMQKLYGLKP